jgi:N-acetylglucosaminyldiphosphoundecaprenol N-acetyl-beta-D-mannosaminyltransferase
VSTPPPRPPDVGSGDPPAFEVAGVKINAVTVDDVVDVIDRWIRERRRDYIVLTGAHGVVEMQSDPELREINNRAGVTTPDGMPVVWLGKLRGFSRIEKTYAPDIMREVFAVSPARGWRHFLYGGKAGVADRLQAVLERDLPGIQIAGTRCPPFRPLTEEEIAETALAINRSGADVVWCGLGCPKQERWMARFRPLLDAPVLIGVGAGFDFASGEVPLAPRWIQRSGFEWLFRLASEPRRLWPRYSRVVPKFIYHVAADAVRRTLGARRPDGSS